jgi:hypothetical protein
LYKIFSQKYFSELPKLITSFREGKQKFFKSLPHKRDGMKRFLLVD